MTAVQQPAVLRTPVELVSSARAISVTPDMAFRWISEDHRFDRQRPLRPRHVAELIQAMRGGTFATGTIMFAYCEALNRTFLVDGQHRLTAIVESGISQRLYIAAETVPDYRALADLYSRLDRGAGRGMMDVIRAQSLGSEFGLTDYVVHRLSPALPLIMVDFQMSRLTSGVTRMGDERVRMAREWSSEIGWYWDCLHPERPDTVVTKRMQASPVAAVGLITLRYQHDRAMEFWTAVAANDSRKDTPERTLADFLRTFSGKDGGTVNYRARAVATAWNAFYEGRELRMIKVIDPRAPIRIAGTPYTGR